jgi:hypothetical protein
MAGDGEEVPVRSGDYSGPGSAYVKNAFTYHPPKGDQTHRYEDIRDEGRVLAEMIMRHCPASRERTLAFDRLREAVMWANASIACNEDDGPFRT